MSTPVRVTPSSGCIWFDLHLPCEKSRPCKVCDLAKSLAKAPRRHTAQCAGPQGFYNGGCWCGAAQGIEAGTDETRNAAQPEGRERGPKGAPK